MWDWISGQLLEPGAAAPAFARRDNKGREVTLESLRGRPAVLVFYPGDDTPTCTKQLCELRDSWEELAAVDAAVYGINGQSEASHERFVDKFQFPFPLLADPGWTMCRAYGCGAVVVRRTVYVLDAAGRIAYAKRGKPPVAEILAAVRGL